MLKLLLLLALGAASYSAHAEPPAGSARVATPHVSAELLAENDAIVPGARFALGLRLRHIPRWHTYWRNPGDSGAPTTIDWQLPAGFSAAAIQWPYPKRLPIGPLTNFGYEDEVLLIVDVTAPARIAADSVTIRAAANWLVCSDVCIPESGNFSLTLPIARTASPLPGRAEKFARTRALHPVAGAGWGFTAKAENNRAVLRITAPAGAPVLRDLVYFPYAEGKIESSAPQWLTRDADGYTLTIARAQQPVVPFNRIHGILVSAQGFGASRFNAMPVDLAVSGSVVASTAAVLEAESASTGSVAGAAGSATTPQAASPRIWAAIAFAFAGGLLLNLMPCVFPILSIKVLSILQHDTARQARREGLAYAFGVVVSFLLLAALLFILRATGEQLGWGFQLQSPVFVALLALLFFLLGLNLSGVFDFGHLLPARVAAVRARNRYVDAAFAGLLAVVAASPCTAPFMGAALGYALGQSAATGFAVFAALGVGMAAPVVVLTSAARARRWLPRPGAWMERLKQLLAFPLYATVIWLAWVLGRQSGLGAVIGLLGAALLVAIGAWLLSSAQHARRAGTYRIASAIVIVGAVALAVQPGLPGAAPPTHTADARWQPWSESSLAAALVQGKPVFVDFTAAWCITCQVNKRLVLDRAEIMQAFAAHGVTLMRADWTRQDPAITLALERLERKGVPVYVLYRQGAAPKLLPEILTKEIVLDALSAT